MTLLALVVIGLVVPIAANSRIGSSSASAVAGPAPCPRGFTCLAADARQAVGPADMVAQGFLHGVDPTTNQALIATLHPRSWRVSDDVATYLTARSNSADVTVLLSDLWYRDGPTPSRAPWQNWKGYEAFVRTTVQNALDEGERGVWWEIQNEPDGYFNGIAPPTIDQALNEYSIAAKIIESLDPSARLEGPSLTRYNDVPDGKSLDLRTFLDFVTAAHLPLHAISWHEVEAKPDHNDGNIDPTIVTADVARARGLLAAYPRLAHVPIFINEYAATSNHLIPGWTVGWIAALEQSGVAGAARSCWHDANLAGQRTAECNGGALDGLFVPSSGVPEGLFWVHQAYANMNGERIATGTSDPHVSLFATNDAGTVRLLVGRHVSCTAAVRVDCHQAPSATPGPINVRLHVRLPAGMTHMTLQVQRIANLAGAMPSPPTVLQTSIPVLSGQADLPIYGFGDGDAYSITLSSN